MGSYPVAECYNARQDNTIQFNTVQYITMTHINQNNIQHSRQSSIRKITKNNKNAHSAVLRLRNSRTKADESVLKTTKYVNTKNVQTRIQ